MAKEIIRAENLKKVYVDGTKTINALDGVSFTVNEGEFVVILGASGAGKSTLLNIIGGMDRPTSGDFFVGGKEVSKYNRGKLGVFRRFDVGFVFQFYNLVPNLNAYENVGLAASVAKDPLDVEEVLTAVGLQHRMKQFPATLSGGEQQRVAIARAIVKKPVLLLCDEPTGALDSNTGVEILTLLRKIAKEENKAVLIVTHNQSIAQMADHLIRLKDGKIIEDKLIEKPKDPHKIEW